MSVSKPSLSKDLLAGLIVFLIALPLCLGIAQASGAPLFAGVVAGVIGGIIIGAFSHSQLSVSGPAAGLIAIVVSALATLGSFEIFLCAVILAGVFQLLLGLAKAGGLALYFPSAVIEGMLAGIGITIVIKEIPNAIGFSTTKLSEGETGFHWDNLADHIQNIQPAALVISLLGIALLALWLGPFRKYKMVPTGLLVVLMGVGINEVLKAGDSTWALAATHLVSLPVPEHFSDFFAQFTSPDFSGFGNSQVWITGMIIAAVASIETLLCIEATDKLDPMKRNTSGNAELRAQGIGNIVSGLLGGLPITSVIVRSSANINAGATSKRSTIFHGALLLVCVAALPAVLNLIPKASLSAILIFTGFRLCRPAIARHLYREGGWPQLVPYLATTVGVVFTDLLTGVGIGLVVAIFYTLRQNLRIPYYYQRSNYSDGQVIRLSLAQEVSFLNKASIRETLYAIPENSAVILDATNTEYIDFDVLEIIREYAVMAEKKAVKLSLIGFKDVYKVPAREPNTTFQADLLGQRSEIPVRTSGKGTALLEELAEAEAKST